MTKSDIKKYVDENAKSIDIVAVVMVFKDKKGNVWSQSFDRLCLNEEYWCSIKTDRYGCKVYGAKYTYNNVEEIILVH